MESRRLADADAGTAEAERPTARLLAMGLLVACAVSGCGPYPRDPDGTSARVAGGVLRAGVSHDPPFVQSGGAEPTGADVELLVGFARRQGARVEWIARGHHELMEMLERRELDVVLGGHAAKSPWKQRVASSRPYQVTDAKGRPIERMMALPPGENAWLLAVDRYLDAAAPSTRDSR